MRMTEEYSRRVLEWVELPAAPVSPGKGAPVAMKLPRGWSVGPIEVAWEPFPRALTRAEIASRGAYGLPPASRTLYPFPPVGARWESGEKGDFSTGAGGRIEVSVPTDRGPGHYFLVVFAAEGEAVGRKIYPVAAPMVTAE